MAEQHGHFGIGHVLDLSGQIVAERRIGGAIGGRAIAGHGVRNRKRQMLRIVADQQRPFAAFRLPCIGGNIEMTERVAVEIDMHTLAFMRGQLYLDEALQLTVGMEHATLRRAHIQLGHGGAGDIGIIGDDEIHTGRGGGDRAVRERGVAQSVAEREAYGHAHGLVITVADEQALAIDRVTPDGRIPAGARAILVLHRPGFGQMSGWVDFAGQRAHGGGGAGLAGQSYVQHGGNIVEPRQFHRGTGDEHDHHRFAGLRQRRYEIVLRLRNRHGGPVEAFGFAAFVEANDGQHHIHGVLLGERDGVVQQHLIRLALAVVTLLVAGQYQSFGVLDLVEDVLLLGGVHLG